MIKKYTAGLKYFIKDENGEVIQVIAAAVLGVLGIYGIWVLARPAITNFTSQYTDKILTGK